MKRKQAFCSGKTGHFLFWLDRSKIMLEKILKKVQFITGR
jgi:hypothetical protein